MNIAASSEPTLEELFAGPSAQDHGASSSAADRSFVPQPPDSFEEAGITNAMAESLLYKFLLAPSKLSGGHLHRT